MIEMRGGIRKAESGIACAVFHLFNTARFPQISNKPSGGMGGKAEFLAQQPVQPFSS